MQRFLEKISKTNTCWLWQAASRNSGYGAFKVAGKVIDAHRFSYEYFVGPIPTGQLVCHTCDNRLCVNPKHLWLGTHSDNSKDAVLKGRQTLPTKRAQGQANGNAKLKNTDIVIINQLYASGIKQVAIANRYCVNKSTIGRIISGKAWLVAMPDIVAH